MNGKKTEPDIAGIDLGNNQFTLSLVVLLLVAVTLSLIAAGALFDGPVGADNAQSEDGQVASPLTEREDAMALDGVTGSECVDEMIGTMPMLPYADHSFAYGGYYIAEAMLDLMGAEGRGCLQEM